VQVVQRCTIPGRSWATVRCRVNCSEISDLGVVEGALGTVQLANSLNRLDGRGEFLVQCVNPFTEPVELPVGSLAGKFHSVQEEDVGPRRKQRTTPVGYPLETAGGRCLNT